MTVEVAQVRKARSIRLSFPVIAGILLVLVLTGLMLVPVSPVIQQTPARDSGIFLYTGSQILQGKILYREVWDHKPPLIFYLEAFGLWLGSGSVWAVWAFQALFVSGAGVLLFLALSEPFGAGAAAAAVAAGWLTLSWVLHGGNYTEEYALLFQAAALFFLVRAEKTGRWGAAALGIGAATGLAFSLKQSLIGIGLSIGLYLALRLLLARRGGELRALALMLAGFATTAGAVLIPVLTQGTLREYIEAAFTFNQLYSNLGLMERVQAVRAELVYMAGVPGFAFALAGWIVALAMLALHHADWLAGLFRRRWFSPALLLAGGLMTATALIEELLPGNRPGFGLLQTVFLVAGILLAVLGALAWTGWFRRTVLLWLGRSTFRLPPAALPLVQVAALALPAEVAAVSLSGRDYLHYNMTLVPVTAALLGFLIFAIRRIGGARWGRWLAAIAALAIIAFAARSPLRYYPGQLRPGPDEQMQAAVDFVRRETTPGQPVLVWSGDVAVNFQAGRANPTHYVHLRPFYLAAYATPARVDALLRELQANPPALVLDPAVDDLPFIHAGDPSRCAQVGGGAPDTLEPLFAYFCDHYILDRAAGLDGWQVYRPSVKAQTSEARPAERGS